MTTQPDIRNVLRGGLALAVWIALVLLLVGSVWELRTGAVQEKALANPTLGHLNVK
jgi:hypothetical protein